MTGQDNAADTDRHYSAVLRNPEDMTPSGIDWLGDIPEGWAVKKLKYLLKRKKGALKTGPFGSQIKNSDLNSLGKYRVYTQRNVMDHDYIKGNDRIDEDKFLSLKEFEIMPFDILFTTRGTIGKCSIFPPNMERGILHPCLIRIQIDEEMILPRWVEHYVSNSSYFIENVKLESNSTIIDVIYGGTLKEVIFPLPPLPEQTTIAAYLDRKTAEIDQLIAQKQRLIALYEEEKTALINHAVTKGVQDVRKGVINHAPTKMKPSGIDWLGDIPEGWEVKKLRYVGTCQNGVSKGAAYFGSGYPFVSYSDVYKNMILPRKVKGLAQSTDKDREHYSVQKGDVFFTRTSETIEEIGFTSTCLNTIENAIFAGFLIKFRPKKNKLFDGFSKYFFRSSLHRLFFEKEMMLVTRASLSQELLKRLPVLLLSIDEQKEIASYLDIETARIDAKISKTRAIIALQKEYRTALISEVVTGKRQIVGA